MQILRDVLSEIVGLFVDDGALAAALLAWCAALAAARVVSPGMMGAAGWGATLAIGCVVILLANVHRSATLRVRKG
jgi:hypothetical protein